MRRVRLLLVLALGLVALAAPRPALAADIYGTWKSTSGNLFEITDSRRGDFKLRLTRPDGTQERLRGDWVPGMEGTQFTYSSGPTVYTVTFSRRDANRVRVTAPGNTTTWWQRVSHAVAVPVHKAKVFGLWRSTSGNVFEIVEAHRGGFKLWVTYPSGKRLVLRGDWVRGMSGSQFTYWDGRHQYTGTFSPDDPDRVRVVAGGTVSWWTRAGGAVAPVAVPAPAPVAPPGKCWDVTDPGCLRVRAGAAATNGVGFATVLAIVRSAGGNYPKRLERARQATSLILLTSKQLATILNELQPHHALMLELVKACAPKLVDPENGATVAAMFVGNKRASREALRLVRAYPNP